MASVSKDAKGLVRVLFVDELGVRKTVRLGRVSKKAARSVANHVEQLVASAVTSTAPPMETARWLAELDDRLRAKLAKVGLVEGLRCPSEVLTLRWTDIDWEGQRFLVQSSKTEHHVGAGERLVPIFPELIKPLNDVWDEAGAGAEFVITFSPRAKSAVNLVATCAALSSSMATRGASTTKWRSTSTASTSSCAR
ncbi:hypothetical protein PLANPX_1706 [Lacipirellula parvula]|uniref:Uncharacterized protein n=1 Tax=Lacipirellula parvula TaxID=2650471 RepID=A0A5K7X5S5_9BACT|nr:hypothetical protein PLANPX_1706 [Lacipirellula parvula]